MVHKAQEPLPLSCDSSLFPDCCPAMCWWKSCHGPRWASYFAFASLKCKSTMWKKSDKGCETPSITIAFDLTAILGSAGDVVWQRILGKKPGKDELRVPLFSPQHRWLSALLLATLFVEVRYLQRPADQINLSPGFPFKPIRADQYAIFLKEM